MKKQTILVGFLAAAFVFVAAGASFAGDRRLHKPRASHWKGNHFAAKHHNGHWKRGHQVRAPRAHWKRGHQIPRHRIANRGAHYRPGHYGHRPPVRHYANRYHAGPSFRRQHDGRSDRGHVRDRQTMQRGDRNGGRSDQTAAYNADDARSNRGNRDASGRQRQR